MKKNKIIFLLFYFCCLNFILGQIPQTTTGKIIRLIDFKSKYFDSSLIDIWLPDNYDKNKKYSVLFMNDGQMLFDANLTWNRQAWEVDDVVSKLIQQNLISPFIVVGIWNRGAKRYIDYFPNKPLQYLSSTDKQWLSKELNNYGRLATSEFIPLSDNYLKFIVYELIPYMVKNYSTINKAEHTFIMGSSMGGLISLYAICEYPKVFGGAACLSTHWTGIFRAENNPIPEIFIQYVKNKLPNPKNHKIYFDCGDKTLDSLYPKIQKRIDSIMTLKGYTKENGLTLYFPGEDHSEKSWQKRLNIPIEFLFRKSQ